MSAAGAVPPLTGLLVVEAASSIAAAVAARMLADHGATVVRICGPDDFEVRRYLGFRGWDADKEVIALDIAAGDTRPVLDDLLRRADVLIEDFPPERAKELGLAYDDVARTNPGLVSCHVSSFGRDDPRSAEVPPRAALVAARLGLFHEQPGFRDGPIFMGFPMVEYGTAYVIVIGALAGLIARRRIGVGQEVDASMFDGVLAQQSLDWSTTEHTTGTERASSRQRTGWYERNRRRIIVGVFECADGEFIQIHTGGAGAFDRAMRLLGLSEEVPPAKGLELGALLSDVESRVLADRVAAIFATRAREEWLKLLHDADVATLPVNRPGEVYFDEHVKELGLVGEGDDPALGRVLRVRPPVQFVEQRRGGARAAGRSAAATTPLVGVRIVDFGMYFAGPSASRILCDLGAEVVKVEPPTGDKVRPLAGTFEGASRGKLGVVLDLKRPAAMAVLRRLVSDADIVHHNMRPGAVDRLGAAFADMAEWNDDVIYLEAPGYGLDGPRALQQSFAPLHAGFTGLFFTAAGAGNRPIRPHQSEDYYTGLAGAVGMLVALWNRDTRGAGAQHLVASQLASSLLSTSHLVVRPDGQVLADLVIDADQLGYDAANRLYRAADGWLCVASPRVDAVARIGRAVDTTANAETIAAAISARPAAEAVRLLRAEGVDAAAVAEESERDAFLSSEENLRSGRTVEFAREPFGLIRSIGPWVRLSRTPGQVPRGTPVLGEHTRSVLRSLGYDNAEIDRLVEQGAVFCADSGGEVRTSEAEKRVQRS